MLALLGMYSLYILARGKRSRSEKLERERSGPKRRKKQSRNVTVETQNDTSTLVASTDLNEA